jgi:plasmid stability protein
MPQLLVRGIEADIVRKLRRRAAALGVSVEEAHRGLLRDALVGRRPGPGRDFLDYLRSIPPTEDLEFPRAADRPRRIAL